MRSLLALCLGLVLAAPAWSQVGPGVLWVDAEGHWDSMQQGDVPVPGGIGDFRQLLRPEAVKKLSFEQRNQLLREPQRLLSSSHARDIFAVPRVLLLEPDRAGFADLARDLELGGFLAVRAPDLEEARRMVPELRPVVVAIDFDPARLEGWRDAAGLERELVRAGAPLVLLARSRGGRQGWALGFDRLLPAEATPEELVDAVPAGAAEVDGPSALAGVLMIGGSAARAAPRLRSFGAAGFEPSFAADTAAVRAALGRGGLAAILVDAEEPLPGGLALLRRAQAEGLGGGAVWLLVAPATLGAPARRLYAEEVESAPEPAAAALATAVAAAAERQARRNRR